MISTARKTTTSTAVKNRWNQKTYKRISISLRKDEDSDLIDWFDRHKEQHGPTEIFRAGIDAIKKEGLG